MHNRRRMMDDDSRQPIAIGHLSDSENSEKDMIGLVHENHDN